MDGPRDPSPKASYEVALAPPSAPFSSFHEFFRTCANAPAVDDSGNLNPALLWLGQYGYWAQSQKLGIRDTWGLFSSGHARLQVAQAEMFFVFLFVIVPLFVGCDLLVIGVSIKMGWFAMPVALTAIVPEAGISMERLEAAAGLRLEVSASSTRCHPAPATPPVVPIYLR
ncbi:hypothetical protein EDB80DRAFT_688199 [Ilyonectria destructans]|nr:hypothetical protein EDB80DRAFT_688199 [Ilyonectria destructans]